MMDYPESPAPESPESERNNEAETTLLPKSMFANAKVGDVIKVKVVAALDDELEVEHAGEEKKEASEKKDGLDDEMESFMASHP